MPRDGSGNEDVKNLVGALQADATVLLPLACRFRLGFSRNFRLRLYSNPLCWSKCCFLRIIVLHLITEEFICLFSLSQYYSTSSRNYYSHTSWCHETKVHIHGNTSDIHSNNIQRNRPEKYNQISRSKLKWRRKLQLCCHQLLWN